MKATAAVCTAPNKIVFDQVEIREPEGTEIRVKITAVGICGVKRYSGCYSRTISSMP